MVSYFSCKNSIIDGCPLEVEIVVAERGDAAAVLILKLFKCGSSSSLSNHTIFLYECAFSYCSSFVL